MCAVDPKGVEVDEDGDGLEVESGEESGRGSAGRLTEMGRI